MLLHFHLLGSTPFFSKKATIRNPFCASKKSEPCKLTPRLCLTVERCTHMTMNLSHDITKLFTYIIDANENHTSIYFFAHIFVLSNVFFSNQVRKMSRFPGAYTCVSVTTLQVLHPPPTWEAQSNEFEAPQSGFNLCDFFKMFASKYQMGDATNFVAFHTLNRCIGKLNTLAVSIPSFVRADSTETINWSSAFILSVCRQHCTCPSKTSHFNICFFWTLPPPSVWFVSSVHSLQYVTIFIYSAHFFPPENVPFWNSYHEHWYLAQSLSKSS